MDFYTLGGRALAAMTANRRLAGAAVGLAVFALSAAPAASANPEVKRARQGTAPYHNIDKALSDGYGLFTDAQGIACIDHPTDGAMGIHYVRGALVEDGAVDAATPEVLVYEPTSNGRLRLVAVEYVVFQAAWDANHSSPPSLFGRDFEPVAGGNRYGLPPFYALHAWLWKHNPSGMLEDWNPRVSCEHA